MAKYIPLDALLAEIDKRRESNAKEKFFGRLVEDNYFLDFLNTLEVKEVNLEKEAEMFVQTKEFSECDGSPVLCIANHFFSLGLSANNPITATDRGTAEEIIINLKRVEKDYRIALTKEKEWVRNQVKKGE